MAVRSSMAALIARTRLLINDTLGVGAGQIWTDQTIQDVLDEARIDVYNASLRPATTYITGSVQFLDYFSDTGGWEDDFVLKQFLTTVVTASVSEPIVGHWQFAATKLPPITISGKIYDVYRAAADLLERQAVQLALLYTVNVDGQSFQRNQMHRNLMDMAHRYRLKQRPVTFDMIRSDLAAGDGGTGNGVPSLAPGPLDYISSGDGR